MCEAKESYTFFIQVYATFCRLLSSFLTHNCCERGWVIFESFGAFFESIERQTDIGDIYIGLFSIVFTSQLLVRGVENFAQNMTAKPAPPYVTDDLHLHHNASLFKSCNYFLFRVWKWYKLVCPIFSVNLFAWVVWMCWCYEARSSDIRETYIHSMQTRQCSDSCHLDAAKFGSSGVGCLISDSKLRKMCF